MSAVHKDVSKRSYIAVAAFGANIFSYTTSMVAYVQTGVLAAMSDAADVNFIQGVVLRENGRKLFPAVHAGVTTYMVGVYDAVSCRSGFIDPNSPLFAAYSSDMANFLADGINPVNRVKDNGAPVYTNGSVDAAKFNISGVGTPATAAAGQAITAANAVVVNNTAFTASSLIFVTGSLGACHVAADVANHRFTITSSVAVDTVNWLIIN